MAVVVLFVTFFNEWKFSFSTVKLEHAVTYMLITRRPICTITLEYIGSKLQLGVSCPLILMWLLETRAIIADATVSPRRPLFSPNYRIDSFCHQTA